MMTEDVRRDAALEGRPAEQVGAGRRSLVARRRLPGGRAVIGGLLVAIAAIGAIVVASSGSGPAAVSVVVADRPIRPGDLLGPEVLRVDELALPDSLVDATYASPSDLDGTVARSTIGPGELVQRGDVVESSAVQRDAAPAREFTLHLDADRVGGGRLEPGDVVDVLATYGTGADAYSVVVLADASVLDASSTEDSIGTARGVTVTLALASRADTLALAHAVDVAQLRVVRTTTARPDAEPITTFRSGSEAADAESEDEG